MLLRSISKHVKDQNWFAVGLDFFIVVVGILIAFQVTEWNEQQQSKQREQSVLLQLEEEFTVIKAAIEKQNTIRADYVENLSQLIDVLENVEPAADNSVIKRALDAARSTGRRPAQSAAYLQLMGSGELTILSSERLQKALVNYDVLLKRDAFIFPELMSIVAIEISTNPFVDYRISRSNVGAAVDKGNNAYDPNKTVRSYDLEALRTLENRYELMFVLHATMLKSDEKLLELVNEILNQISVENN